MFSQLIELLGRTLLFLITGCCPCLSQSFKAGVTFCSSLSVCCSVLCNSNCLTSVDNSSVFCGVQTQLLMLVEIIMNIFVSKVLWCVCVDDAHTGCYMWGLPSLSSFYNSSVGFFLGSLLSHCDLRQRDCGVWSEMGAFQWINIHFMWACIRAITEI